MYEDEFSDDDLMSFIMGKTSKEEAQRALGKIRGLSGCLRVHLQKIANGDEAETD